jgi:hypothetical protein
MFYLAVLAGCQKFEQVGCNVTIFHVQSTFIIGDEKRRIMQQKE